MVGLLSLPFEAPNEDSRVILSIIVPVYNELQSLPQVLDNLLALPRPEGLGLQVIVINDGSTDGSGQFLRDFPLLPQLKVVHLDQNQGKGAAVRVGLVRAEGDIVAIQDADQIGRAHV